MRKMAIIGAFAFALSMASAQQAAAQQFQTFMLVPGIPGEALEADHRNWIDILSMSQGATAAARKSTACDVAVHKWLDTAGPALWVAVATGQVFPEIRIEVIKSGGDQPFKVYEIKLANVRFTSISSSSSSELPTESLGLSPQSVTLTYNRQSVTGAIIPGIPQTISCQ